MTNLHHARTLQNNTRHTAPRQAIKQNRVIEISTRITDTRMPDKPEHIPARLNFAHTEPANNEMAIRFTGAHFTAPTLTAPEIQSKQP